MIKRIKLQLLINFRRVISLFDISVELNFRLNQILLIDLQNRTTPYSVRFYLLHRI